jgi:hypothetical protein
MPKLCVLFLFSLLSLCSKSQIMDSLDLYFSTKPKFIFKFDSRHSYVSHTPTKVFGFKTGLDFRKKIRIGIGYHELEGPRYIDHVIDSMGVILDTVPAILHMNYISVFIEYVIFNEKKWEISLPFQWGFGSSKYEYTHGGEGYNLLRRPISVFEPTIEGHYKIIPFVGIGAGIGYRFMLLNNKEIEEKFNSPIYILKIKVFLGDIYKAIFKKPKR